MLAGLLACVLLSSCKKDDDTDTAKPAADLIGTWAMIDAHTTRVNSAGGLVFDRTDVATGTATFTSDLFVQTIPGTPSASATYTRSGNTITYNVAGAGHELVIQELTSSALTLRQTRHDVDEPGDTQTRDVRYQR